MLTPEHKEARRAFVGGSDAPSILGYSTMRGPWSVWVSKARPDIEPEDKPDPVTTLGSALEPWLRRQLAAKLGGVDVTPASVIHAPGDWRGCSPDGWVSDGETRWGCELKTEGGNLGWDGWGEPGTDQVRRDYLIQSAWCMAVADVPRWDVLVLAVARSLQVYLGSKLMDDPGCLPWVEDLLTDMLERRCGLVDIRVYHCHRSAALEEALTEKLWAWWARHVIDGHAPPNDDSEVCRRALALLTAAEPGKVVHVRGGLAMAVRAYGEARRLADEWAAKRDRMEGAIKRRLGGATELMSGEERIATWRPSKNGRRPFLWKERG